MLNVKPLSFKNDLETGFTFLEMILVVAIIGLTMSLVIPRMDMGQTVLLKAQVREAVAILNHARRSAIIHGKPMVATFATTASTQPRSGQWVSRGAALQWGEKMEETEKQTAYEITFYPEGGSSGGTFSIVQGDYKVKITVNPLTGKVETIYPDAENNE